MNELLKIFTKHYNFNEVEPRIRRIWDEIGIYKYDPNSLKPCFSVDTPPPYVSSAHLHVGHAMSYSQAEFVVRYKRMTGHNVFYPMGFDDNGLPTERFVEKKYKLNKRNTNRKEFIELCLKETTLGAQTYKDLWQALGISVDWDLTYSTIDERSRRTSQKSFLELVKKGLIKRRYDPITWCYNCSTSLAQADIDTKEVQACLYDIRFTTKEGHNLVISTTRPELLPACVSVYANKEDPRYIDLIGKEVLVPLFNHTVKIRTHKDVEKEFGSGLMMVCTWGDAEDIVKWREHNLDTIIIFDQYGKLNEKALQFSGLKPEQAREAILAALDQAGLLVGKKQLTHNVGVHDRCETPVEFCQTKQWFIEVLDKKKEFLDLGNAIEWHPEYMKTRYVDWVNGLKWDWCISRQRFYGVPFPVWYCTQCGTPWYPSVNHLPVDPMVDSPDSGAVCGCGNSEFIGEKDVMDTWMTSSCTPLINALWATEDSKWTPLIYPMSLRVQAFEIIRTWLFYTVVKSYYHHNALPWKAVMISGWGLDDSGKKMSKSAGNFVEPEGVIQKYSADALRYWSASATLGQNLRYSEADVSNGRKLLTKLWNASKFIAQYIPENINHIWNNERGLYSVADRWIYVKFMRTVKEATESFEAYQYSHALQSAETFFLNSFCDNYLEIVKVRLWEDKKSDDKVAIQTIANLLDMLLGALKLFAPFIPYITEEIYQILFKTIIKGTSIHIEEWPKYKEDSIDINSEIEGDLLIELISEIRKIKTLNEVHSNFPLRTVKISTATDTEIFSKIEYDLKNAVHAEQIESIAVGSSDKLVIPLQKGKILIGIEIELGKIKPLPQRNE